jgi:hypothetical protein
LVPAGHLRDTALKRIEPLGQKPYKGRRKIGATLLRNRGVRPRITPKSWPNS